MKASEWSPNEIDNYGMLLFVGRSGCGKSGAGASHPGWREIEDMDYRFGGIGAMVRQKMITDENLNFFQYPNTADGMGSLWSRLNLHAQNFQNTGKSTAIPAMIQFDSAASWAEMVMTYAGLGNSGKGQTLQVGTGPKVRLSHPGDYRFEIQMTRELLGKLKSFPCTIIWTGHLINRYGKKPGAPEYSESEVIGEMLNARDKFAEDFVSRFDNVFRFDRTETNGKMRFTVKFFTDLAKNTFGIPPGEHNVTDIPFFTYFKELLKDPEKPTLEVRKSLGEK